MTNELDLLRDYINGEDASHVQLDKARSALNEAIRSEIASRPSPASKTDSEQASGRTSKVGRRLVVVALATVAATAVLIFQVTPGSKEHASIAAAAQISKLAASVQPTPPLQPGQWSSLQMTGQLLASVSSVGSTKTPDAQASVPVTIGVWSNTTGTTCTSQQFGTATFASPVNAQAWASIGLVATPFNQPATGCVAGVQAAMGGGLSMTPINVSNLTHDPVVLAQQLQSGMTGVTSIDQLGTTGIASATQLGTEADLHRTAFARLAALIVGPTSGSWDGYNQEMLRTMALLPGVVSLGRMAAHSGQLGLGFTSGNVVVMNPETGAATEDTPSPVVLLDPLTGALLEARNFTIPVLENAGQDFVGSPTAAVYTDGVSYGISTQWIDPVPSDPVIPQSALPTWISSFHSIEAIGNPNVNGQTLADVINPFLGDGNSAFDDWNHPTPSQTTFEITIANPATSVSSVVAAINASGLFQSVVVEA
jgi:hypothetical protein